MKAIVVFHDLVTEEHPLTHWLKKGFWHCFVCVASNGLWISVDGEAGVPVIRYLTEEDFDLAKWYRDQGLTVVETHQHSRAVSWPLTWRNCVGLVKGVLCIRSWAITPWQLYRHLTRGQLLPGIGGSAPAPIVTPSPPPQREDPSIAAAKKKLRFSERTRRGRRATILTSGRGLENDLGNITRPEARGAQLLGQ